MARLIFVAATLIGALLGAYLLTRRGRDYRAARAKGGTTAFMARTLLVGEALRFGQILSYVFVAINAAIINQSGRLSTGQFHGVLALLVGLGLLEGNSANWTYAQRELAKRFGPSTLDIAERLEAMTVERDIWRERAIAAEQQLGGTA